VDLEKNKKTQELWLQAIAGGEPMKLAVAQAGDSGVQFSADGKRILFLSGRTGASQIWLADFDSATGATAHLHKLTNLDLGIDNAKWAPDGRSIVFTAPVYPDCPAIVPSDNGAGAECDYDRDAKASDSKVKAQIFTHLLYRHWDHFTGQKRSHLFVVDVATGGMRDLNPNDPHDVPPEYPTDPLGCGCAFSPDSKELAFTENLDPVAAVSTNADIFVLDLTDPSSKARKISTSPGGDFSPAYSSDGKYLARRSQARAGYESDKFRLWLYDRGTKTGRDLLPKFDDWVDEFAWGPNSSRIYFVSEDSGEAPVFRADLPEAPPIQLTAAGEYSSIHALSDGSIVATRMMVDDPGEVFHLHPDQVAPLRMAQVQSCQDCVPIPTNMTSQRANHFGELAWDSVSSRITHLNDALLAQLDLPKMEPFRFTAQDGTKLEGFLIRPPGFDATKKYPVKFLIHGGPQGNWGDDWSYRWNAELFAANGYVVVMINPRGSTGYGQAIVEEVSGDWGGKPFTDLMTGLDYAEQHYSFIDKDRECALGASYGGYMANWILGHTNRFKCIVTHDGMFNAESAFGTTEEDWFNIWEFKEHPWDYYGKPDAENPFRKWSPSLSAKNFKTPTLVVHGQLDYRLDVSEGFQLFDTLQLLGVPSKMLYFPDEGHWVLKPQNSQLWYKTVNDWVDQWTTSSH
jgi:dipeptidyl aminopeptidase/acylaminoacyl peptidase